MKNKYKNIHILVLMFILKFIINFHYDLLFSSGLWIINYFTSLPCFLSHNKNIYNIGNKPSYIFLIEYYINEDASSCYLGEFWLNDIFNAISKNLIQIVFTIITGIIGYIGVRIKKMYQEYIQDKLKKEIIEKTVKYVEQTSKDLSCKEKKNKALKKSLEWMKEKKINISDTELEILIESAVNCL